MAHKTFISYKYDEAQELRDRILNQLGSDATFYRGETSESPDLTDFTTETIRKNLSDMIFDTSVMIVIISPRMLQSKWMEWEIRYALREQSRNDRTSHANGVVCVVQKEKVKKSNFAYAYQNFDSYAWAKDSWEQWDTYKLFSIINNNRKNRKYFSKLSPNYIDIVTEDDFLRNPSKFIEEAFMKSLSSDYKIVK